MTTQIKAVLETLSYSDCNVFGIEEEFLSHIYNFV